MQTKTINELYVSWLFVRTDITATVLPASIIMISAMKSENLRFMETNFLLGILYFWFYIYQFNTLNQIFGCEEDKINRPDRPIPSGFITVKETFHRYIIATICFWFLGYILGVMKWASSWSLLSFSYNVLGLDKHWITKNIVFMSLGVMAELAAAREIIVPMEYQHWRWFVIISIWVGTTGNIQDFRDEEGDKISGRKTLPLHIGANNARMVITITFLIGLIIISLNYIHTFGYTLEVGCYIFMISVSNIIVIWRLMFTQGSLYDHVTYNMYTYLYCLILSASLFLS